MNLVQLLAANLAAYIAVAFMLGLLVGSFTNVVALRLPRRMQWQWRQQCAELLEQSPPDGVKPPDLVFQRSRCTHCGHGIRPWENIPILSFVFLRGRCSKCGKRISWQYPTVELVCGILTAAVAWRFGFSIQAAAAMVFSWAAIALAVIDIREQLLPDDITLPLLWLGLLLSVKHVFTSPQDAIIGATAGYLSLWLIYHLFRLLTKKEGMGYGDFKLFAAIGAWFGWQFLVPTILLSAVAGAVVGMTQIMMAGRDRSEPIPFGPYLAAAGWVAMMWGRQILDAYWRFAGF
ncbi:MAG: prepilin peptidase [Gammaproteobacteria bacterium]|nr:MAG: prepilin peptidase [Gammaproteobacteria bacterium]